jgi:hypothetical protein
MVDDVEGKIMGEAVSARAVIARQVGTETDINGARAEGRYIFLKDRETGKSFIVSLPRVIRDRTDKWQTDVLIMGHVLMFNMTMSQGAFNAIERSRMEASGGRIYFQYDGQIVANGTSLDLHTQGPNAFVTDVIDRLGKELQPQMKAAMALGQKLFDVFYNP